MRTTKLFLAIAVGAAALLTCCNVNDPIYETTHPGHGTITLTTDWSATNISTPPTEGYTVATEGYSTTLTGTSNAIDHLYEPGDYTIYINTAAKGISVSGTSVAAAKEGNHLVPQPDWLYTGVQPVTVERDTNHKVAAAMAQQVRELTLVIEPAGGTTERIADITGTLSGVAGSLDFATGIHGSPSTVALKFAKDSEGKWSAGVRLLGVTDAEQKLSATMTFTDGIPGDLPFDSDLSVALANFNADKKTPLTLSGQIVETPAGSGFTATIIDWIPVQGGGVIAD